MIALLRMVCFFVFCFSTSLWGDTSGSFGLEEGSSLQCSETEINPSAKEAIFLANPGERVVITYQNNLKVSADKVVYKWDKEGERSFLFLHNVEVDLKDYGQLRASEELLLRQKRVGKAWEWQTLLSKGETHLTYTNTLTGRTDSLISYGTVEIDQSQKKVLIESPKDAEGKVLKEKQVYFRDTMGTIYADHAEIDYELEGKTHFSPLLITLKGDVRLYNRFGDGQNATPLEQYALADLVVYSVKTKELLFTADSPRRVLFFDKINHIRISAKQLKGFRDPETQKDSVQGIGDVRFTFTEEELQK